MWSDPICKIHPMYKNDQRRTSVRKIFEAWISTFGPPSEIICDNDVRLTPPQGFFKKACELFSIKVTHTTPYRPQFNGLCERTNRSMLPNLRVISQQLKTIDWPTILPIANAIHNEQVSTKTGYPPCELFLGRPPLIFPKGICDDTLPILQNWISHQIS